MIMKKHFFATLLGMVCLSLTPVHAQFGAGGAGGPAGGMGAGPQGPDLSGTMARFFGEHTAFSATMVMQVKPAKGNDEATMPGKLDFDQGKSRWEMEMSELKSAQMPPQAAAMMKNMGLSKVIVITTPEKKKTWLIYPDKKACVDMPLNPDQTASASAKPEDYKIESTELGKETVDGHPCVKNKMTVTDKAGNKQEATVWNATDLKKFPVKLAHVDKQGNAVTMSFKDVTTTKPAATRFEIPAGFTKYGNIMELMMSSMGGMMPGQ